MLDDQPADAAFVAWLQWQLERQLAAVGGRVPILQDLPIGVDPGGADAWAYQDVLALDVSVGAPPDPFNRAGQDWGLPPFVPWRLRAADYEPFVEAIRATTALAGGLRVDHVMGLFRLWWIPAGSEAVDGGYVRYPSADLLDIVALESVRAGAFVVGEDLGTVEQGVRSEMRRRGMLSYRLAWFESRPPERYPPQSVAALSTHDLPTVAGVWTREDVREMEACGLGVNRPAEERTRRRLQRLADVAPDASLQDVVVGAYTALARAPSMLLLATLDDAAATRRRPNMPGTVARPNWSLPLPRTVEQLRRDRLPRRIADALSRRS